MTMKYVFIFTHFSNFAEHDYAITFLPISSTEPRTSSRFELLNVSLLSPHDKIYTALPVLIADCYISSGSFIPCELTLSDRT